MIDMETYLYRAGNSHLFRNTERRSQGIFDSDGGILFRLYSVQGLSDSFPEPHGHSRFSVCLSAPHAACMKYKNIFKNKIIYNDDSS